MPKFSIIIPACCQEQLTRQCLDSIKINSYDYEVILIQNGAPYIHYEGIEHIINPENVGFPKAVNQGILAAKGEIIVILNNDTIVTPNWLDHLAAHLEYADVVGPVSNNVSGPQKICCPYIDGAIEANYFAQGLYEEFKLQSSPWYRLVFFCVAIKREVIDKIGMLDEQFSPGNFEDDDFCLRAIEANFKLVIAEDVFIYHFGSQTHKSLNIDHMALLKTNEAKFNAKWSLPVQEALRKKALTN